LKTTFLLKISETVELSAVVAGAATISYFLDASFGYGEGID
jgi:hypothetical protein